MVCLMLDKPEVQAQLNEYTDILGSENAAYYVLSENNGFGLEFAPNGQPSELFSALLNRFNGDRNAAIKEKAKIFTESFRKYFGDWLNDGFVTQSNLLDANGEPVIDTVLFQQEERPQLHRDQTIDFNQIFDPKIYIDGMSTDDYFMQMEEYLPDTPQTHTLLNMFRSSDISVRLVDREALPDGVTYMYYDPSTNRITVSKQEFGKQTAQYNAVSMLHEMVHAFTAMSMMRAREGRGTVLENNVLNSARKLLSIYREVLNDIGEEYYGLTSEDEFIAELLTNPQFYEDLITNANQHSTGMFNRIYNALRELWNNIINFIAGREISSDSTEKELTDLRDSLMELLQYNVLNNSAIDEDEFISNMRHNARILHNKTQSFNRYHFDTEEEMNKRLRDVRNKLVANLESRLKAVEADESTTFEQKEQIKYQLRNLKDDTLDTVKLLMDFVNELSQDVAVIAREVRESYKGSTPVLSDERLVSLSKNYFGFYCNFASTLYNSLVDMDTYKDAIGQDNYKSLVKQLQLCKNILDTCFDHVKRMQAENAKRLITRIGISAKSNTILKYIEENSSETDNDISVLTRIFSSLDRSGEESLKALYQLVQDTENIIENNTFIIARKLLDLLERAGGRQKLLFELDDNGNPTGYIIRDLNYGKMYREYKEFLKKLRKDLGINPNDLGLPENADIRTEYNKRRNKWLSDHVERKYTSEYYSYFNDLSMEATLARESVMSKIRNLKDKYRGADGIVRYEEFTDEDYSKLLSYYTEKKQLASIYNIDGSIKEEGTVERRVADELIELNKKLSKGIKMKVNREKFEQIRKQKAAQYGENSEKYRRWFQRNTRIVLSEEFYKLLDQINRQTYPDTNYAELDSERRALLDIFRDPYTGEVNVKLMPIITRNRLDKIDSEMRNIRKTHKAQKPKTGLTFDQIAKVVPTEAYKRDRSEAIEKDIDSPGELIAFDAMYSVMDRYGINHPKSYYSKVMPLNENYVSIEPSLEFCEMSDESPFVNPNYDKTNPEYYQPKRNLYDNSKAYNKVMQDENLRNLRQALIDVIKNSNSKLTNLTGLSEYKMPQISGSSYRFLKARGFKGIGAALADQFAVSNDDPGYNDKVKTAPDGSSLAMVPQYFIRDLEDPATITADLVGSVIQYYRMAENFKQKSAIKGKVENIKAFLRQRSYTGSKGKLGSIIRSLKQPKQGSETNVYKMAEKFINMNVYDVKTNNMVITIRGKKVNISRLLSKFKNYATLVNLGLNFACAATGFFTAMHNYFSQLIGGRYYDFNDSVNAFKDLIWDLIRHGLSVGNRNYKSDFVAAMDYFGVGSTMDSMWKHSNRNRLVRAVGEHWAFGAYSASDYVMKGWTLRSIMYNYRNVGGKFMYKEEFLRKFGNTAENRKKWRKYKSFAASIRFVGGKLVAINSKDQEAVDKIKYTIGNTAKNLSFAADGMLTPLQKAQFTTNVFGALVMMHRQYIPTIVEQNFTMKRQWDYTTQREVEALWQTPLRLFAKLYQDGLNIKALRTFFHDIFHSDDVVTRANMRRIAYELSMVFLIQPMLVSAVKSMADKDKRDKWKNFFAYVLLRTAFEDRSQLTLADAYGTIKSPSASTGLIDNFNNLVMETISPLTSLMSLSDARDRDKRITRGAYKHMTPFERALIKCTPFKNIIELNDLPSKRRYYETQIVK